MRLSRSYFILVTFVIAACSQPLQYVQPSTPQTVRIAYLTALSPIVGLLQYCISEQPEDFFVINEISTLSSNDEADLIFWLGEKPPSLTFAASIGWETFAIVLNPENPLERLGKEDVRALFSGEVTNWSELEGEDRPVSIWVYPEEDEIQRHFLWFLGGDQLFTPMAFLASSPSIVKEAVASDPGAIGVLPYAWIDDSIVPISIDGEPQALPILVLTKTDPQGPAREFIACSQSPQGQAVLRSQYIPWENLK